MRSVFATVLIVAVLPFAQGTQTFTGVITDGMCPLSDHSRMRMGATDAECAIACVDAHGAQFVLYDGQTAYTVSDQPSAEKLAGKKVRVTGKLNSETRTIDVASMASAE